MVRMLRRIVLAATDISPNALGSSSIISLENVCTPFVGVREAKLYLASPCCPTKRFLVTSQAFQKSTAVVFGIRRCWLEIEAMSTNFSRSPMLASEASDSIFATNVAKPNTATPIATYLYSLSGETRYSALFIFYQIQRQGVFQIQIPDHWHVQ